MAQFIEAEITILDEDEGGHFIVLGYRPHLIVDTSPPPWNTSDYLGVSLFETPRGHLLVPGETAKVTFALMYPGVDYSPLEPGVTFRIIEGMRSVGTSIVPEKWEREI